ncbi:ankyrin repeat and IBR domain-containing protein 1-like [Betta splendens]|uniref:Ankyrin repeat and IBR domain-containing protein 1-like n=1 Tax=Betta splendens TaxID=158456 RepID=A0A6P7LWS7_BETSP|nr:ankyrin repeat and IBR domain-containing protein 1-like [Betta splendens]
MGNSLRRRSRDAYRVHPNSTRTEETEDEGLDWIQVNGRRLNTLCGTKTLHPRALLSPPPPPGIRTVWIPPPPTPPSPTLSDCSYSSTEEKCYDPQDPALMFVDGEDELDFLCEGFRSRRALMSCGHAVTPTSLTNWCHRLLDEGESRFVCGQTGCNVEWSYEEVCKMALLTPEEKKLFERAMSSNAARANTRPCPGCESPVVRTDLFNLRVHCSVCSVNRSGSYDFCWQCLREWKGPDPRSDRCDNHGCRNQSLKTLKNCPYAEFESVGVSRCPSIRACPTCGILLQHDNTECKNVVCPRCKVEFCFVCLKLTDECLLTSEEFEPCFSRVAPRQTSIPVWRNS